ncbi:MAG: sulfide/dihydroorotate dehydrogenase-like FAD/NAD-binding protein, partial [Prevotella salivae]|nr:sulfide/dihydroorotate dehydrogenase-like FAD/NAD-binding protein [Segatella salivae]
MNKIISKQQYSEKVFCFDIEAPLIARSRRAGNFVIVRVDKNGERMPLTIADSDKVRGTIKLVVQKVGLSSTKLCNLNEGDFIADVVGPLGNPTHIENYGTVICAGGGVGVAPMLPIMRALKDAGNRVLAVIAGRNKELVILEDEVKASSDELIIMTDDGSYGEKGVVTIGIEKFIQQEHIDKVFAIGPPIMMKFCCLLTQKYNIPTDVSLNTIMVDGTGMCGACRLTIGGKTKFVCIDGPEFNGAEVDWDEMFKRMSTFKAVEQEDMSRFQAHVCKDEGAQTAKNQSVNPIQQHHQEAQVVDLKAKDRIKIPRVSMPELDPIYRATTRLEEVNQGLTAEMAIREAQRCLDCKKPTCVEGCPVNINIPGFIKQIEKGNFLEAARVLKQTSALPAVCGRVCPQEKQCESRCIHHKMKSEPVAIGYLERFAADFERESGQTVLPELAPKNGIKVAVVGSGPSGLSFAGDMIKNGFEVYV